MVEVLKTPDGRGFGLYATKHYSKGERIGPYTGEKITKAEVDRRYGGGNDCVATYVVQVGKDSFIDGTGSIAFSNDAVNLKYMQTLVSAGCSKAKAYSLATDRIKKNAVMRSYSDKCTLYATRPIHPGEEILWSYGWRYWLPY